MSKDIFRSKKDFSVEEFATEIPEHKGQPVPREAKTNSQNGTAPGMGRKDKKVKMGRKLK